MWLKIKNLGKYINNLQKEWVISTMLLSCTYIEMKCVFYVNTLGLLSLKWIKNEPNIMHVTSNEQDPYNELWQQSSITMAGALPVWYGFDILINSHQMRMPACT